MKIRARYSGMIGGRLLLSVDEEDLDVFSVWAGKMKKGTLLSVDVKKWKPLKTNAQLALLFSAIEYFCAEAYGEVTERLKNLVYRGLVEKYGEREECSPLSGGGKLLVPIRLSECNRYEQFEAVFQGLFAEAAEQGVDMRRWVVSWSEMKYGERTKKIHGRASGM